MQSNDQIQPHGPARHRYAFPCLHPIEVVVMPSDFVIDWPNGTLMQIVILQTLRSSTDFESDRASATDFYFSSPVLNSLPFHSDLANENQRPT